MKAQKAAQSQRQEKKVAATGKPISHGVGRRKTAVARVWLRRGGTGSLVVNGKRYDQYFDTDVTRIEAYKTMTVVPSAAQYDVEVNVVGGGLHGQAGAVRLGVARAFLIHDEAQRPLLRQSGLLTVDDRQKERKKYGRKGARRSFQFVKR